MERSINIENGGTLTDICVWDGTEFTVTKTLTTPFDLRRFFDGITTASAVIYGRPALSELLHSTKHIRCSTTQGTNALVERRGTRIGLITDDAVVGELRGSAAERAVVDDLVGDRVAAIDVELSDKERAGTLVRQVNRLTTDGAARLVVAAGNGVDGAERRIRRILFTTDRVRSRRIWSSVLNSFLHPTVERFLYNAEDRLRSRRVKNPLLIYRNDGASSRVAKSVASRRGRERKMLSAVLGMLAMLPVVFGVAGWAMVSR
ncbi:MAG TPA: hydantoinase/oxoprolinase N-terminal domain-containing protein [Mycobacterium sp.]|nr:hydantoinase/oxoprolinase N-terminal domain-containing protein [Mycobacterium sp.]